MPPYVALDRFCTLAVLRASEVATKSSRLGWDLVLSDSPADRIALFPFGNCCSIALIKPIEGPGRLIDECIAIAQARGSQETLDEGCAADLREIIAGRKSLDKSVWE